VTDTKKILQQLRDYESRNITFMDPDGSWPIVWERARGVWVWDAAGKKYLDTTAAFGVAAAGHANPRVVRAGRRQMGRLLHAMGDVHPHALKARLARELSRLTFERWTGTATGKVIFANSGFEAVEAALKTALLATGKRGVIAFEDAYHGLGYGALNVTHRDHFRGPFQPQLGRFASFLPFPRPDAREKRRALAHVQASLRRALRGGKIGAVLVEPVQARGGINVPPPEFLPLLRQLCDEFHALLILDEIYTGFGRTGKWFACEHTQTMPDLICLGKALTGGFPLSACVGRADLMDAAWPPSDGEAIHTSTFLGHPVGCAMALAQITEIEQRRLPARAAKLGAFLLAELSKIQTPAATVRCAARGLGLMAGWELTLPDGKPATQLALRAVKSLLHRGYIFLPEGGQANVISFTPPLTISRRQLAEAVAALASVLPRRSPRAKNFVSLAAHS
jgi:4-aminobutyrate aminotransferase-like enzyme